MMKIDVKEVLRYAGAYNSKEEKIALDAESVIQRLSGVCTPRSVYAVYDLVRDGDSVALKGTDIVVSGQTVNLFLKGATKVVLIAATLTPYSDMILAEESAKSTYFGLLADAFFTAEIEAYLDEREEYLKTTYPELTFLRRFSAGYGDFSIEFQENFLKELDAEKTLGIRLVENGSYMMAPNKSVTALIGAFEKDNK